MTTNLNVIVDSKIKEEADKILKKLGLDLNVAINMFLLQIVKTGKLPFEIECQGSDSIIKN